LTLILDAWAVLTFLRDEPAAPRVEELIATESTLISSINLGEVLYSSTRERGEETAEGMIDALRAFVTVEHPDWDIVTAAARIKAGGGLSYADAFCVATAQRHQAPLYTGDPEILALKGHVELVDLRTEPPSPEEAQPSKPTP
jgi:PIN domain nuclease of toxin-antitoxin system